MSTCCPARCPAQSGTDGDRVRTRENLPEGARGFTGCGGSGKGSGPHRPATPESPVRCLTGPWPARGAPRLAGKQIHALAAGITARLAGASSASHPDRSRPRQHYHERLVRSMCGQCAGIRLGGLVRLVWACRQQGGELCVSVTWASILSARRTCPPRRRVGVSYPSHAAPYVTAFVPGAGSVSQPSADTLAHPRRFGSRRVPLAGTNQGQRSLLWHSLGSLIAGWGVSAGF